MMTPEQLLNNRYLNAGETKLGLKTDQVNNYQPSYNYGIDFSNPSKKITNEPFDPDKILQGNTRVSDPWADPSYVTDQIQAFHGRYINSETIPDASPGMDLQKVFFGVGLLTIAYYIFKNWT